MRLSTRDVKILYYKKLKEGMKPQEAYDQIKEEFKFLNQVNHGKKRGRHKKINFDKEFKDLKNGV
jgi:hypothetical protein